VRVQPVGLSGIEAWLVGMRTDETTAKIEKVAKRINDVLREEGLDITIDLKAVKKGLNRKTKKAKQRGEAKGKPTAEQLAAIKQMAD